MRIALVITEIHPGGAEKCFVNLACFLQERGHEVRLWQLWPEPPPDRNQLARQLTEHGIPWSSGGAVKPWDFWSVTRWLRRELNSYRPEMVQSFLFHANLACALALRGHNCRLMGGARVAQPEWWRQQLQRWAVRRMERLVCVSQSVADHITRVEGVAKEKLYLIPNGTQLPDLHCPNSRSWSELGLPDTARVLLFVGRLTAQKGIVEFLTRSAERLLRQLPEHHLVLMGEGDQAQAVQSWCLTSSVAQRVHVVGWQAATWPWMRQAEVLVLPAKYEGMPNVVLEAMAVAKPVACFEVDGVRELLGEEEQAVGDLAAAQLAAPQDYAALEAIIVRLAQDEMLRAQCGVANRQRVEQHFQLEQQLAKYEQLYLT